MTAADYDIDDAQLQGRYRHQLPQVVASMSTLTTEHSPQLAAFGWCWSTVVSSDRAVMMSQSHVASFLRAHRIDCALFDATTKVTVSRARPTMSNGVTGWKHSRWGRVSRATTR